jgi:hypothetical protein
MSPEQMQRHFERHREAEAAATSTRSYDLATLCDEAALPLDEVRAGAQARAEELSSATGG